MPISHYPHAHLTSCPSTSKFIGHHTYQTNKKTNKMITKKTNKKTNISMLTQFHLYIFGLIVKFFFMKLTTLLELYQMFFCLSSTRNQDLTCGSILLIIILKDQGKKLKNSVTECSLSCPSNSAVLMQVPLHNIVWGNWGSNNTCCCSQGKLLGGLSFIKYISLLLIYICSL